MQLWGVYVGILNTGGCGAYSQIKTNTNSEYVLFIPPMKIN